VALPSDVRHLARTHRRACVGAGVCAPGRAGRGLGLVRYHSSLGTPGQELVFPAWVALMSVLVLARARKSAVCIAENW